MKLTCAEISVAVGGIIKKGDPQTFVSGVNIDSRNAKAGDLFVPLSGERVDGHQFIADAFQAGAAASLTVKPFEDYCQGKVVIEVKETLSALQNLAAYYRNKFDIQVVGITGSSGKTTTKDLAATVLGRHFCILKTEGNYNNHIGLPLTTFNIRNDHEIAVMEMAMRGLGEIALLTKIAAPQWAIITNIGEAHLELLGSKEKIADAKGELLCNMKKDGTAILNGDDPCLCKLGNKYSGKVYYYGWGKNNHFRVISHKNFKESSEFNVLFPDGRQQGYFVPIPGKHNISNSLSAIALGYLMGIEVGAMEFGLWSENATAGRMHIRKSVYGVKILDDTYNANPDSMKASLEILKDTEVPGIKTAVLGDMLELGNISESAHREIGRIVAESGLDYLITVGKWSEYISLEANKSDLKVVHCQDNDEAWEQLKKIPISAGNIVLIKGSRSMRLENIVDKLLEKQ